MYDPYLLKAIRSGILGKEVPFILLHKGTKKPLWPEWTEKSIAKIPKVEDLLKHNIGLRLDQLAVIDVDRPADIDVKIPETTVVTRGEVSPEDVQKLKSRGHLYFKRPEWLTSPVIRRALGIDIYAGPKRHMVIPPSIHPSEEVYRWHRPEMLLDLPELPKEVYEKIKTI